MIENHFIVGMSRAGTTWISNALDKHSKVSVFGESCFFGRHYIENKKLYSKDDLVTLAPKFINGSLESTKIFRDNNIDYQVFFKDVFDTLIERNEDIRPSDIFDYISKQISEISKKSIIIEKTPHHLNYIERIKESYPQAKFIIMKRNAVDFLLSYKHQSDRKVGISKKELKAIYHPLGALLIYRKYLSSILKNQFDRNTIIFELNNNDENILKEVQEFLDIEQEDINIKKVNSSFNSEIKKELLIEEMFWLNLFGFVKYDINYFSINNLLKIIMSMIKIPKWGFNSIVIMKKNSSTNIVKYFLNILKG
ncbi:sulfotransferase [Flammeovirga sp. SJP92]|uniref:sulfotransferase family protein n=1 Tax=Flammeovirga sp. SJP92 TaxID=1775430 RepID=UPI0007870441|nr:sulfotransferase [Flammeovirga sp. SJP92]KXX72543.1 hypothetical protein AVL50_00290 [Flammeovirga sp. SJP92]